MVSQAEYCKRDPQGRKRGAGYYYHRGNGVYSKRDIKKDLAQTHHKGRWAKKVKRGTKWKKGHMADFKKTKEGAW